MLRTLSGSNPPSARQTSAAVELAGSHFALPLRLALLQPRNDAMTIFDNK